MFLSYSLVMGVIVHIACQVFKVIYYSVKKRKLSLHYLLSAGGMPSTHSAFTATVSLSLGLTRGFDSEYFAIAAAFTAIVIYDSLRLRGAVQTHSDILLKLSDRLPEEDRAKIPRMVGHTFGEIVVGLAIAIAASVAGFLLKTALGF
jgi:acid phosphatase family membrane protein YuiD